MKIIQYLDVADIFTLPHDNSLTFCAANPVASTWTHLSQKKFLGLSEIELQRVLGVHVIWGIAESKATEAEPRL